VCAGEGGGGGGGGRVRRHSCSRVYVLVHVHPFSRALPQGKPHVCAFACLYVCVCAFFCVILRVFFSNRKHMGMSMYAVLNNPGVSKPRINNDFKKLVNERAMSHTYA